MLSQTPAVSTTNYSAGDPMPVGSCWLSLCGCTTGGYCLSCCGYPQIGRVVIITAAITAMVPVNGIFKREENEHSPRYYLGLNRKPWDKDADEKTRRAARTGAAPSAPRMVLRTMARKPIRAVRRGPWRRP